MSKFCISRKVVVDADFLVYTHKKEKKIATRTGDDGADSFGSSMIE